MRAAISSTAGPDALAAAVLDVVADGRNDGDLRLHVAGELALDLAAGRRESARTAVRERTRKGSARWDSRGVHHTTSARGVSTRETR